MGRPVSCSRARISSAEPRLRARTAVAAYSQVSRRTSRVLFLSASKQSPPPGTWSESCTLESRLLVSDSGNNLVVVLEPTVNVMNALGSFWITCGHSGAQHTCSVPLVFPLSCVGVSSYHMLWHTSPTFSKQSNFPPVYKTTCVFPSLHFRTFKHSCLHLLSKN